jgi:two-component system response regulator PilR (NtrC family)
MRSISRPEPMSAWGLTTMADAPARILIVDDEESVCDVLAHVLRREGYAVETAGNGDDALRLYALQPFDFVIQDLRMPGMDGTTLLRKIKSLDPQAIVAILTAYKEDWARTVECMRLGAFDYISKPFDNEKTIKPLVKRALQLRQRFPTASLDDTFSAIGCMKGNAPAMREIYDVIHRVAPSDSTVFIQGESGTGKELVARAIHFASARADRPFITVNCGVFTETLLESELFGHVKGSFTGAVTDKRGILEVADTGTFFLDEIGDMPPSLQVKLLRVIEDREFIPVGGTQARRVDVRFIAATNRNIEAMVAQGAFREDLYYRVNIVPLALPPLRERKEDIPLLVAHFIARYSRLMRKPVQGITDGAMNALLNHDWPGNVRELENTIQRTVALLSGPQIDLKDVTLLDRLRPRPAAEADAGLAAEPVVLTSDGIDLDARLAEIEKAYLSQALAQTDGHQTNAAQLLHISLRSLRYKLAKYGMDR